MTPGGAAARSGLLRLGDRVVGVDGVALEGGRSLQEVLRPAASHVLEVLQRGKKDGGEWAGGKKEGGVVAGGKAAGTVLVPLIDCTEGVGLGLNKSNEVTEMTPGGAAARSGLLRRGDRVVAVDGEALEGGRALQEVLRPAASHVLEVLRREEVLRRAKKGGGEAAGGAASANRAEGGKAADTVLVPLIDCTEGVGLGLNRLGLGVRVGPGPGLGLAIAPGASASA